MTDLFSQTNNDNGDVMTTEDALRYNINEIKDEPLFEIADILLLHRDGYYNVGSDLIQPMDIISFRNNLSGESEQIQLKAKINMATGEIIIR